MYKTLRADSTSRSAELFSSTEALVDEKEIILNILTSRSARLTSMTESWLFHCEKNLSNMNADPERAEETAAAAPGST